MKRQMRQAWKRDIRERKRKKPMLAREKWQIKTIEMLERVFDERVRQMELHGAAMENLPDGTGPDVAWLEPLAGEWVLDATSIEEALREEYEDLSAQGRLTRMHLVREEIAEAFERLGDDPEFVDEILQVAALCVQWAEYKS